MGLTLVASAADFTWQCGPNTPTPQFKCLDIDPTVVRQNDRVHVVYGAGGAEHQRTRRFEGPNMDHLRPLPDAERGPSFTQPFKDDCYWISSAWMDPQTQHWYATVHVEFSYHSTPAKDCHWFRRIGLATSTNLGANWEYRGDILTSDNPLEASAFSGHYYDWGCGDQKLFVDAQHGWFYLYYMHAWTHKQTGQRYQSMRVARCRIADKMAPGKWTKWYQGRWAEPGLGGHDTDVFLNADNVTVSYNTYLKRYLALGTTTDDIDYIATCTDLARQDWARMERLSPGIQRLYWYNFPATLEGERMITGQTFRIYSSRCNADGVPSKYMEFTLGPGRTDPAFFTPQYPPESVPDGNPNWDWHFSKATRR